MSGARSVLLSALIKAENSGYSNLVLNSILQRNSLEPADKGFVTAAFYGVLERKITLDACLNRFLKRPIDKAPPVTRAVLRSGTYQILYMDKIPASAAVNESVKLIKASKEAGNSGLVNAVLRKMASSDVLNAVSQSSTLSVRYSVAPWISGRLVADYGADAATAFLEDALLPPPVYIKWNNIAQPAESKLSAALTAQGVMLTKTDLPGCYMASDIGGIEHLKAYRDGWLYVQDYASQACAAALDAQPGMRVFDCCAAPGGKSFTIAINRGNVGELVSADLYPNRVKLISEGAKRLGLSSIQPVVQDATVFNPALGLFDCVLCDAPCSGIGVIRRKPEIKYKTEQECDALPQIQSTILSVAAQYVRQGGRLVYSTCTLLKDENEMVVNEFLQQHNDFNLTPINLPGAQSGMKTFLPPDGQGDGFFLAVMERRN